MTTNNIPADAFSTRRHFFNPQADGLGSLNISGSRFKLVRHITLSWFGLSCIDGTLKDNYR